MADKIYAVSEDHLRAFGSIITTFARFERLIELVAAHVLGTSISMATVATSGLGYGAKCEATLALIGISPPKGSTDTAEKIKNFIDEFNKFSPLRNHVAHRVWKHGTKHNTIKPIGLSVRGKLKGYGLRDDDREYTAQELIDIANLLIRQLSTFTEFLVSNGITPNIAENTDDTNPGSNNYRNRRKNSRFCRASFPLRASPLQSWRG